MFIQRIQLGDKIQFEVTFFGMTIMLEAIDEADFKIKLREYFIEHLLEDFRILKQILSDPRI